MENETIEVDVRDKIVEHLKNDDRSLLWLHEKTKIPYGTIYSCFTQRLFKLSDANRKTINEVLGTEF
jgi:hypothetical protein